MNDDEYHIPLIWSIIIILCISIILITCFFEAGLLLYSYITADKVECNMLWCEFTDIKANSSMTMSRECFENGERVNCSQWQNLKFS